MRTPPAVCPDRCPRLCRRALPALLAAVALAALPASSPAKGDGTNEIPHGQSVKPGPALTPQEAIDKMKLPPGFKVDLVASEPQVDQPDQP